MRQINSIGVIISQPAHGCYIVLFILRAIHLVLVTEPFGSQDNVAMQKYAHLKSIQGSVYGPKLMLNLVNRIS